MAKFNTGDWVEITPNPDYSWSEWTPIHDDFCGAVGKIMEVQEDFMSGVAGEDNDKIKVAVDFKECKYDDKHTHYWMWFLKRHVIHSTKEDAESKQTMRKQGSELQQWEATKKRIVDDGLRKLFTPPSYRRRKKSVQSVPKEVDLWDEKTDPMIPLPGSTIKDDDGVIELPDDDDIDDWFDNYGP